MQHPKKTIDARLRAVAEMALASCSGKTAPLIADIGCDHGYTSQYVLRQRADVRIIAGDISEASLKKASLLLSGSLYGSQVKLRVGDGLSILESDEHPDAIMIAGMGGRSIADILQNGINQIGNAHLILQPNTDVPFLRKTLFEMGFSLTAESFPEAAGKKYVVIVAQHTLTPTPATDKACFLGTAVNGISNYAQRSYYLSLREKNLQSITRAARSSGKRALEQIDNAFSEIKMIQEALLMKTCTVNDVCEMINKIAPFELAEEWDNVGILFGHVNGKVSKVLVALDITRDVLAEAEKIGCELIVTHHPFMFRSIQRITDTTREGALMLEMAKLGISQIAAHTNLDAAPGGVNDTLLETIGATDIRGEGCLRVGDIPDTFFGELCKKVSEKLHAQVRSYGDPNLSVHCIGCCSGAGADEYHDARALGADCFLTGEVRHNVALDALHDGIPMIEAGHFETENPVTRRLTETLQKQADALQYDISVFCSGIDLLERGE